MPPAIVLDLDPIRRFMAALDALEVAWMAIPLPARRGLQLLVWLHPAGYTVGYQVPEETEREARP